MDSVAPWSWLERVRGKLFSDGVSMLVNPKYRTHSVCVMGSEEKVPSFREVTPVSKGDDCVIELEGILAVSPFGWEVFVFSAG